MTEVLELDDIIVDVARKGIKNVHLSVRPPMGRVRISAPQHMSLDAIRLFAISKVGWIRQQQRKFREQARETPREHMERESHFVWGGRYLLAVVECDRGPAIRLEHNRLVLSVRPGTGERKRHAILEAWYREQLRTAVPSLVAKWQSSIGVSLERFFVQRMKTKWGSCNPTSHSIRLNTDLVRKPPECLEYVVVHEMVHFVESTHSARFVALMDQFMPQWRVYREQLNRLPVRHERWDY